MVIGMTFKKSAGILMVMAMALVLSSAVQAQTPAGTVIQNQASATFEDTAGNTYTATSNQVTTIVLPVYGVSVLPDGTVAAPGMVGTAIPGQTVYYSYNLTNTGNDSDDYTIEPIIDAATATRHRVNHRLMFMGGVSLSYCLLPIRRYIEILYG